MGGRKGREGRRTCGKREGEAEASEQRQKLMGKEGEGRTAEKEGRGGRTGGKREWNGAGRTGGGRKKRGGELVDLRRCSNFAHMSENLLKEKARRH